MWAEHLRYRCFPKSIIVESRYREAFQRPFIGGIGSRAAKEPAIIDRGARGA
jgi:hypothetical protein